MELDLSKPTSSLLRSLIPLESLLALVLYVHASQGRFYGIRVGNNKVASLTYATYSRILMRVSRVNYHMHQSIQLLQNARLKATNARKVALHFFKKENRPVDVEEILFHLKKHKLETDRATVYRMIEAFLEKGILIRLEFGEGKYRYELAGTDHHHLICENCGSIEDISDCGIEKWEKEIKKKKGFQVERHSLEFFGLCRDCHR